MKMFYAGEPGDGYGWGCCNKNLILELGKLVQLLPSAGYTYWSAGDIFQGGTNTADVVFMPIADHNLKPIAPVKGKVTLGLCFFESPLGPNAVENAKQYDVIFAGSTWCLDRLAEKGIHNTELLIQGVDQNIFKPQPPRKTDGQFRIFSGGKFEYRKGQDLVIKAFQIFSDIHADARLVCSWFNPWPLLAATEMQRIGHSDAIGVMERCGQVMAYMRLMNDRDCAGKFMILSKLSQFDLARETSDTDVGLFPNRCEGGTNLVLMEYASIGRKIIANAKTGHADVESVISYEIPATTDENHWAVQSVDDIVAMLELAYQNRELSEHWSTEVKPRWTWAAAAEKIVATALRISAEK